MKMFLFHMTINKLNKNYDSISFQVILKLLSVENLANT